MNGFSFIINLLWIISVDIFVGFILFMVYKYVDGKYFSSLEIEQLKEENKYLREENRKLNGVSSNFWSEEK